MFAYSLLVQFVFIFVSIQAVYGGQSEQPVTEGINISHLIIASRKICKITYIICLKSKDNTKFKNQYKLQYTVSQ